MSRIAGVYFVYFLTLLSALAVYLGFSLMLTVAAGVSALPIASFLASIVHFGFSSWLFFVAPRVGKLLAILTALITILWPLAVCISMLPAGNLSELSFYALTVLANIYIIFYHTTSLRQPPVAVGVSAKIPAIGFALSLFIYAGASIIRLFQH